MFKQIIKILLILILVQSAFADNYTITEGSGRTMAADDISSVVFPRVKLIYGGDNTNSGDVSITNPFPVTDVPNAVTGWANYGLISANTTNATSVKGSAGVVGGWIISNNNASQRFVKLYNKASAPTVGTDTPYLRIPVPGNTSGILSNVEFEKGVAFSTGIAFAITAAVDDSDTTAVAANEVVINLFYK